MFGANLLKEEWSWKKNMEPKSDMKQCAERFQTVIMRRQKKSALTGSEGCNCSEILLLAKIELFDQSGWIPLCHLVLEGLSIHSYDGLGKKRDRVSPTKRTRKTGQVSILLYEYGHEKRQVNSTCIFIYVIFDIFGSYMNLNI